MIAYEFSWLKSEVFFIYHCICMIRKQQSLVEHERIGFFILSHTQWGQSDWVHDASAFDIIPLWNEFQGSC